MTEAEAGTKWCPHARVLHSYGAYNKSEVGAMSSAARCIASQCMMWMKYPTIPNDGRCGLVT